MPPRLCMQMAEYVVWGEAYHKPMWLSATARGLAYANSWLLQGLLQCWWWKVCSYGNTFKCSKQRSHPSRPRIGILALSAIQGSVLTSLAVIMVVYKFYFWLCWAIGIICIGTGSSRSHVCWTLLTINNSKNRLNWATTWSPDWIICTRKMR